MKLRPYESWIINDLRRRGFTIIVVDPKEKLIRGLKADKAIVDDAFAKETAK